MSGLAIVAVVGMHAFIWWGRVSDPMAWYVDAGAILIALAIALPALKRSAAPTENLQQQSSAAAAH